MHYRHFRVEKKKKRYASEVEALGKKNSSPSSAHVDVCTSGFSSGGF